MKRSQAAEQKNHPAAFHLESMILDDGSLNSSQEFANSILLFCHRRGLVGLGKFGQAGHPFGCQEIKIYWRLAIHTRY